MQSAKCKVQSEGVALTLIEGRTYHILFWAQDGEKLLEEGNTELKEESLSFQEPIKPEYISEEVLFSSEPKEVINYSLFDNDEQASVVEETSATEACEADESNAYQISFGDFNDINSAFDNKPILSTPKVKVPKKCFAEKILEAEPPLLEWYEELKNTLLSYKKIKSRLSNSADTFNIGRVQLAKLFVICVLKLRRFPRRRARARFSSQKTSPSLPIEPDRSFGPKI